MTKIENVIQRVNAIRRHKRRSIHDCATILGISNEHYLKFEEGLAPLSLPEIELLAVFFDVPLELFMEDSSTVLEETSLFETNTKSRFTSLRHKMIQAKLVSERKKSGSSISDVAESTQLSETALQAYENGETPVPIDQLKTLSDYYQFPFKELYQQIWEQSASSDDVQLLPEWQPEFPQSSVKGDAEDDDAFNQLLNGLKQISIEEQAQIAKLVLEKLRKYQ